MKKIVRLTESDLHNVIKESVDKILKEVNLRYWVEENEAKYKQAVDILSKYVIERLGEEEILENPDSVEEEVRDGWEEILNDELVQAIHDKYDVACITHKYAYGGGGWEVLRDLEIDVKDNALNILRNG